jgi:hypothetical protein
MQELQLPPLHRPLPVSIPTAAPTSANTIGAASASADAAVSMDGVQALSTDADARDSPSAQSGGSADANWASDWASVGPGSAALQGLEVQLRNRLLVTKYNGLCYTFQRFSPTLTIDSAFPEDHWKAKKKKKAKVVDGKVVEPVSEGKAATFREYYRWVAEGTVTTQCWDLLHECFSWSTAGI